MRAFERKILRRIYESCLDPQTTEWRKRHNSELCDLYNKLDIINKIKRKILEWADYVKETRS